MDGAELENLLLRAKQKPDYDNAIVVRCDQVEWMVNELLECKNMNREIYRLKFALKKIRKDSRCKKAKFIALEAIDR